MVQPAEFSLGDPGSNPATGPLDLHFRAASYSSISGGRTVFSIKREHCPGGR